MASIGLAHRSTPSFLAEWTETEHEADDGRRECADGPGRPLDAAAVHPVPAERRDAPDGDRRPQIDVSGWFAGEPI